MSSLNVRDIWKAYVAVDLSRPINDCVPNQFRECPLFCAEHVRSVEVQENGSQPASPLLLAIALELVELLLCNQEGPLDHIGWFQAPLQTRLP